MRLAAFTIAVVLAFGTVLVGALTGSRAPACACAD